MSRWLRTSHRCIACSHNLARRSRCCQVQYHGLTIITSRAVNRARTMTAAAVWGQQRLAKTLPTTTSC